MDPDPRWYYYLIFFALVIFGGFFAAAETALTYSNKFRMKVRCDDGNKKAKLVLKMSENMDKSLTVILIGNNVIHIGASVLGSIIAVALLKSEAMGTLVATIVTTLLVFVFSETIPKNIAQTNADGVAMAFSYPLYFLCVILTPIAWIFQGIIFVARKIAGNKEEDSLISEDDFTNIIESVEEEGVIDEQESSIIQAAVEFNDKIVGEVLTPKEQITAINVNATRQRLLEFLSHAKYSRYPVYEGNIDNIIGLLHVRSYLKKLSKDKSVRLRDVLIAPYKVHPSVTMDEMFENFRQHKTHIAIVCDDNNKTVGLLTMEDVLEELVDGIDEKMPGTEQMAEAKV